MQSILEFLYGFWLHLLTLQTLVSLVASIHVVLYKRDPRAAVSWIGLIWLTPLIGAILYVLLGINRVRRRAIKSRGGYAPTIAQLNHLDCPPDMLRQILAPGSEHLIALARLTNELTARPLLRGNTVDPLLRGDEAYPAMIEAIDSAAVSVTLSTYIFANDRAGKMFIEALGRAVARKVEVRVLMDDIGARYTWPSIEGPLRRAGVQFARFMPTLVPGKFTYANLRNHRKMLVVDGRVGFTGGLNIRDGHYFALKPAYPIDDLHFRLLGPVVAHLQEVFATDWEFCTDETLQGEQWFPALEPVGTVPARGISAGPDADVDKLRLTLLAALTCAESSVTVITPYFLPDGPLIAELNVAALRGVEVDIILPEKNNLATVQWASTAMLWQLLERGCRVWLSPPPFDHTKLMVVDHAWTLLGSANWEPRSLRLNFEFDVECYDRQLAAALQPLVSCKLKRARRVTLQDVDSRSIPVRMRDGIARLLTPYL